jgi:hypothetical protein
MVQKTAEELRQESTLEKGLIAGVSCAIVAGILNPFDVTKIKMQNESTTAYRNIFQGIRKIWLEEGYRGLLRGLEPSMFREITYSSIRIGGYEPIRQFLCAPGTHPSDTTPTIKLFSALISGGVGSAIINPVDIIKTRLQAVLPNQPIPYKHTIHGLITIYNEQQFSGLYKGWMVTSSRAAVLNLAQLGSYDSIKHNLLMKYFGFEDNFFLHFTASMAAGVITTTAANPCMLLLLLLLLFFLFLLLF